MNQLDPETIEILNKLEPGLGDKQLELLDRLDKLEEELQDL